MRLLLQTGIRSLQTRARFCERGAFNSAKKSPKRQIPPEGYAESIFRNDKTHPFAFANLMCGEELLHHKFGRHHEISGLLLYARTTAAVQPDGDFSMSGNRISVKTLDLNQPFENIARQLDKTAEKLNLQS